MSNETLFAIRWSFVGFVAGIFVTIILSPLLRKLLPRITRVEGFGLKIGLQETPVQPVESGTGEALIKTLASPIVLKEVEVVKSEVLDIPVHSREDWYQSQLAGNRLLFRLERINHRIFGSQLQVLFLLNTSGALKRESIRFLFDKAKEDHSAIHEKRDFEDWLDYLTNEELIEDTHGDIEITPLGQTLLLYLIGTRDSIVRNG